MAVADLGLGRSRWGDLLAGLITHRRRHGDLADALRQHPPDEIKTVIEWAAA